MQAQVGSGDDGNGSLGGGALGVGGGGGGVVGAKRCSYDDEVACNQIENMLVSLRCQ